MVSFAGQPAASDPTVECRATTITLRGEVDLATIPALRDAVRRTLADSSRRSVVLDMAAVTFIDCATIGALLELNNHARTLGKRLETTSVPPAMRRVLALAGAEQEFGLGVKQPHET